MIIDSGRARREMTFQLSPSTYREGELTLGATVSVRYRLEGSLLKATAVSTHPEKEPHRTHARNLAVARMLASGCSRLHKKLIECARDL